MRGKNAKIHRPKTFDPPWIDFFTQPCPYQIKQYTNFPQFGKLPKELQLLIWKYAAIPEPRQLTIKSEHVPKLLLTKHQLQLSSFPFNDEYKDMECRVKAQIPGVLHACADSREEGLKMYKSLGTEFFGHNIFINFNLDILVFANRYTAELFIEKDQGFIGDGCARFLDSVKYVAVRKNSNATDEDIEWFCSRYYNLQHLAISVPDELFTSPRPNPFPETWFPGSNAGFWKNSEDYISWMREDWLTSPHQQHLVTHYTEGPLTSHEWVPPVVTLGNETQWASMAHLGVDTSGWVLGTKETWGSRSGFLLRDLDTNLNP